MKQTFIFPTFYIVNDKFEGFNDFIIDGMKSVLILSSTYKPNIGGIESFLEEFMKFLGGSGYFSYLLTFKQATYSKVLHVKKLPSKPIEKTKICEIRRHNYFDFSLYTLFKSNFVRDIFTFLNIFIHGFLFLLNYKNKISIIHAQDPPTATAAFFLSKIFKKKWVVSFHNIYRLSKRGIRGLIGRYILQNCPCIFAISKPVINRLKKDLKKPLPKIVLSKYWIDTKLFRPKDRTIYDKKIRLTKDDLIVLFVGRVTKSKGIPELIDASRLLKNVKLLIVGSGDLEEYVKRFQNKNLIFLGPKVGEELVDCYNVANVSIFPTTYSYEGFGRVIIESLACGTPVIISDKMPFEAISQKVGMVIKPTPQKIANALNLFDRYFPRNIRSICRDFAIENYSEKNAIVILNIYKSLIL